MPLVPCAAALVKQTTNHVHQMKKNRGQTFIFKFHKINIQNKSAENLAEVEDKPPRVKMDKKLETLLLLGPS